MINSKTVLLILFAVVIVAVPVSANTTVILYASHDAYMQQIATSEDWSTLAYGDGNSVSNNPTTPFTIYTTAHASNANKYIRETKYGLSFNLSNSSFTGKTIYGGTLRTKYYSKIAQLGGQSEAALVSGSPAATNTYVAGDFNSYGSTEYATRFNYTSTSSGNVNFTLNTAGVAYLNAGIGSNKTLMLIDGDVLDGSFSGVWGSSYSRYLRIYGANDTTYANRPFLELDVDTTPTTPPVANFTVSNTTPCVGDSITFTDTSTNTPTSWSWTFGDGNTSILQNPSKTYAFSGVFDVNLTATNAGGSDSEVKTSYINVSSCTSPTPTPTPTATCGAAYTPCDDMLAPGLLLGGAIGMLIMHWRNNT